MIVSPKSYNRITDIGEAEEILIPCTSSIIFTQSGKADDQEVTTVKTGTKHLPQVNLFLLNKT